MMIMMVLSLLTPEAPATPLYVSAEAVEFAGERDPRYRDCLALIDKDVVIGRIGARQWLAEGGGPPAHHCLAIADLAAGFPKLAAIRLTELSERRDAGDDVVRARLLGQAALAWLEAGENKEAVRSVNEALEIAPDLGELYAVAAKAYAAEQSWEAAAAAVTQAEDYDVTSVETFLIRGRAYSRLGRIDAAADDVLSALKLDPTNLDALVLRGELIQRGVAISATIRPAPVSQSTSP